MSADHRRELERRLNQTRRLLMAALDPLTRERLLTLMEEIEEELAGPSEAAKPIQ
jgi:TATA-binding protein-associated factor Taf7